jgi:geranylgeranylglycerol-phosphate geranylgeranyltransferase
MKKLKGIVLLLRPKNAILASIGALVGWFSAKIPLYPLDRLILCLLVPSLILMGGNAINDFFDVEIDKINRPYRPIPSGLVRRKEAALLYLLLSAAGTLLSYFISVVHFAIALFFSIAWYLYGLRLKKEGIIGNILVSLGVAFTIVYGGLFSLSQKVVMYSLIAFLVNLAREIAKGVEDMEGDRAAGVRTIAVTRGEKAAGMAISVTCLSAILFTYIPFILGLSGSIYLILSTLAVLLLLHSAVISWNINKRTASRTSMLIKASMLLGLLAMLLDSAIL